MALITDLVSYWKMDEASGNMIDANGSNDGTVDCDYGETGKINDAYGFVSANTDKVTVPDATLSTSDFTIAGWIKVPNFTAQMTIFGQYDTDDGYNIIFRFETSGRLRIYQSDGGSASYAESTILSVDTWYYVSATYVTATKTLTILINGDAKDTDVGTNERTVDAGADATFGTLNGASWFNGIMDEFAVWSRALSEAELLELYNGGSGLAYPFTSGTNCQLNIADDWKDIKAMQINISDSWKAVEGLQINIGDSWKTIF